MRVFVGIALLMLLVGPALAWQDQASTITGCLSKGERTGEYVLTDEKTGEKTIVKGLAELDKHAANHKVTLTGKRTTKGDQTVFEATAIKHIAATCLAPTPK